MEEEINLITDSPVSAEPGYSGSFSGKVSFILGPPEGMVWEGWVLVLFGGGGDLGLSLESRISLSSSKS